MKRDYAILFAVAVAFVGALAFLDARALGLL
jgi:hypothetical protein